jgi:hypothetical protein
LVLLFCSFFVRNFASTRFEIGVLAVVETFPLVRPLLLFVLACAFALVETPLPALVRLLVELCAVAFASERFRASFDEADFSFGLTAALARLLLERPLTAPPRFALRADVVLCLGVTATPVLLVDFLRAAIVISTPDRATTRT